MDLAGYKFSRTHEWVKAEDGTVRVGITEYAQSQLGDVIYVELPKVGDEVNAGGKFGVIESVKAASDLYSPVSGTVSAVNEDLATNPEKVNEDPYGAGWMLEASGSPGDDLLDEAGYKAFLEGL
jgi:glycine cleavage system H protein